MIETREDYELFKTAHPISKDTIETIEALREVARAAEAIWPTIFHGQDFKKGRAEQKAEKLYDTLKSLPDWLLEADGE